MSIYNLLREELSFDTLTKNEITSIDLKIQESFSYPNNFIIKKTASRIKEEIQTQHKSARASGIEVLGFKQLLKNTELLPPQTTVNLRSIDSNNWGGQVYYSEKKETLGVLIGKKRRPNWKTPPNWDGSELELIEYNKTKQQDHL